MAATEGIAKDDKDSQNIAYWEMKWSGYKDVLEYKKSAAEKRVFQNE